MRLLFMFVFGISTLCLKAQHIRPIKDVGRKLEQNDLRLIAERLVQERQYPPALDYYKQIEEEGELEGKDIRTIANLHYLLRDYENALNYYDRLEEREPMIYFEMGKLSMTQGKYDEAKDFFSSVLNNGNSSTILKNRAQQYMSNVSLSKTVAFGTSDPRVTLRNRQFDDYLRSGKFGFDDQEFFDGSTEVKSKKRYTINSDLTIELDSILIHRIYSRKSGKLDELSITPETNSSSFFSAVTGFDSNQVIFSVYDPFGDTHDYSIFSSINNGNRWTEPKPLPSRINTSGFSTKDPMVAKTSGGDVFIFFSSNRPGGFGGYDIWMSQYVLGEFKKPVNLGIGINTAENEVTPFFDVSTGYLFFSSNGHAGLGEMDVFLTRVNWGGGKGKTFNLGKPLNSPFDDSNFTQDTNGKNAYIISNRENNCCDKPISLNFRTPFKYSELPKEYVEVATFDQFDTELSVLRQSFNYEALAFNDGNTEFILNEDADIEGSITRGNLPVSDRKILLVDNRGEVISSTISDNTGQFSFKQLPEGGQYSFILDEKDPSLKIDVRLKSKAGQVFGRLNNAEKPLLFDFRPLNDYVAGVWTLNTEDATISGQLLGGSIEGEKVLLIDERGNIVAAAMADAQGKFSFKRLPPGEKYAFVLQERDTPIRVDVNIKDNLGRVVSNFSSKTSKQLFKYRELNDYEAGMYTIDTDDISISGSMVAGRLALGNKKVLLIDGDGKVIGMSFTDNAGNFTFRKLPPGKKYSFVIEESDTDFNIDVAVLDNDGNIVTRFSSNNRQEVFKYRPLKDYEDGVYTLNEDDASFNGLLSNGNEGVSAEMIVLIDDSGNIINSVFTDVDGRFEFSDLVSGGRYSFGTSVANRSKELRIDVLNSRGGIVETLDKRTREEIFRYQDLSDQMLAYYAEHSTICGQFGEPGFLSSQVVLINGKGNVVACVEINRYGYFQFDDVAFTSDNKFVIDGCDTEVMLNIEVVDATGTTTNRINSGKDERYFRYLDFTSSVLKIISYDNSKNRKEDLKNLITRNLANFIFPKS